MTYEHETNVLHQSRRDAMEVEAMTPDEINQAIAEALGWTHVYRVTRKGKADPNGVCLFGHNPKTCEDSVMGREYVELPDYCHDLNAMHEAEKVFDLAPMDTRSLWYDYLGIVVGWNEAKNPPDARFECSYLIARATARQRAEAFLRTLGKWRES